MPGKTDRRERRPQWLRKSADYDAAALRTRQEIGRLGLHTVCESARCPNIGECFAAGTATFLILGDRCTRGCRFCAVDKCGAPADDPDPREGEKIARYMKRAGIDYAVITSVTRDDLDDGGASHFARVVQDLRRAVPDCSVELLIPDFQGDTTAVDLVCDLNVQVVGHNLETVRSLYPRVRPGADYGRSLDVVRRVAGREGVIAKTGIMVGLGESRSELRMLFDDVAEAGVPILTMGQYLRAGSTNLPVVRYYTPEEMEELRGEAEAAGVRVVVSGPYVRSSYMAEDGYRNAVGCLG